MARELQLNIDIDNRKVTNYNGLVKQGDLINLIINVLSIKEEFNLDGYIVKVFLKKSDGTKVEQSVNTRENIVSVFLDLQATTNVGKVYGELLIIKDTTQITSSIFTFEVEGTISQEALEESKDSIETFNKVLIKLNEANTLIDQYSNAMQPIAGTTESLNALNNIKTTIDSNLDELIDKNQEALTNKNNLDTSIDEAKKLIQSAETVTNLANKVETNKENIGKLTTDLNDMANNISELSNSNLLINGDFQIWQRGVEFNCNNKSQFTADRWWVAKGIVTKSKLNGHNALKIVRSPDVIGETNVEYRMEGLENFRGKTLTLSWEAEVSTDLDYSVAIFAFAPDYSTSFFLQTTKNYKVNALNKIAVTFSIPENLDSKFTNLYMCPLRSSNIAEHSIAITDLKLEIGARATPFIPRSYGEELALCQRYYETCSTGSYGVMKPAVIDGYLEGVQFRVVKRITPTVSIYDESGVVNKVKCTSLVGDSFDVSSVSGISIYGFRQINILGSRPFPANKWGGYTYIADSEIY